MPCPRREHLIFNRSNTTGTELHLGSDFPRAEEGKNIRARHLQAPGTRKGAPPLTSVQTPPMISNLIGHWPECRQLWGPTGQRATPVTSQGETGQKVEAKPHPHGSLGEQLVGALPAAHVGASWLLSVLIVIDLERRRKERGGGAGSGRGRYASVTVGLLCRRRVAAFLGWLWQAGPTLLHSL